jgi:hypothetical protein
MSPQEPDVCQHTQNIRSFINEGRKHHELRQDKGKFSQVCSSLDVIEDSEQAITAFGRSDFGKDVALGYLVIYGVLQATFLQQDAVWNLCEALGIPRDRAAYPSLAELREIRNASIGHPTKQDHKKPTAYSHITQMTMSIHGFDLLTFKADGNYERRRVDLPKLVAEQRQAIGDILLKVTDVLKMERESHKARFRMDKLAEFFPDTMSYYCEKVGEGVSGGGVAGSACLTAIKDAFFGFRAAALERNPGLAEQLDYGYATIDHAIASLARFLGVGDGDPLTARIFVDHLSSRLAEMRALAQEIDDEYASKN